MFFFFFFFEQDVVDFIKQSLQGDETLEAGEINEAYAYDYLLPNGCKNLRLPEKTAVEVKKNLAPGLFSVLVRDAENAYETGKYNHFLIVYEDGEVFSDWIPDKIKGFISFLSKKQIEEIRPFDNSTHLLPEWKNSRDLRIAKLRSEIKSGKNTLFVGAGLSRSLGVPDWNGLLKNLHENILKSKVNFPSFSSIFKDSKGSNLIIARYLNDSTGNDKIKLISEIRNHLYNTNLQYESDLFNSTIELLKLKRIGEIITYNYDTLLEQRMLKEGIINTSVDGKNRRIKNAIPVMHVHGVIDPKDNTFNDSVVLSEDEYHRLYNNSFHWANVTQLYALTHTTCIFVGLSMKDPSLRRLLDIAYQQGSQDVDHYAFLIRSEYNCHKETEVVFSQMGINIIWCEDFDDVPRQIRRLV